MEEKLKNNKIYNAARQYLIVDGYSVIPVGLDKRPLLSSWKEYQTRRPSEEELEIWWTKFPHANVGIVTGKVSGIIVIDIDTYKEDHTKADHFPKTLTYLTGNGGYHLIYNYVEGFTVSANAYENLPGVDMRSDGGYIVATPSVTSYLKNGEQSGGEYKLFENNPIADFPVDLFPKQKKKRTLKETVGVHVGSRNDSLTSVIGTLLLAHPEEVWYSEVLPAVETIAKTYNPPLPKSEVKSTFDSIVRLEKERRDAEVEAVAENNQEEKELRAIFVKDKTKATYQLAKYLTKRYDIITVGEKEREMFVYQSGMYTRAENEVIYPEIQRILDDYTTKNAKTETFHKIADMTSFSRKIFTETDVRYIPLKNGVYDFETGTLLPHDSKYRFKYQFPVMFDADAVCEKTDTFLDQVLTKEQRETVEEWLGYYFYRYYMFKKAIIFVGEGDTGKTTLLEVISHMIGPENISAVSLHKMTSDKFAAAHLYEKHANIVDELSDKDVTDTGNFKVATGGGTITGEYKFGNQFSFQNFAKFTFACNQIPDVQNFNDEAYFNRWMVIRFEKKIEKIIPNFIKTLTTEEERSGLFNLAMKGLRRLLEQGKFSYASSAIDTKLEMMRSGSSIANFVAERVVQDNGSQITKEDMYEFYCDYCSENELGAETIKMFGTKFAFYVPYVKEGLVDDMKNGKHIRSRGWRNIKVVSDKAEEEREKQETEEFLSSLKMPTVEDITNTSYKDD